MLNPTGHLAVACGIILSRQLSAKGQRFAPMVPRLNTADFSRGSFARAEQMQREYLQPRGALQRLLTFWESTGSDAFCRAGGLIWGFQASERLILPHPRARRRSHRARTVYTAHLLGRAAFTSPKRLDWIDLRPRVVRLASTAEPKPSRGGCSTRFTESWARLVRVMGTSKLLPPAAQGYASIPANIEEDASHQSLQLACCQEHPWDATNSRVLGLSPEGPRKVSHITYPARLYRG